MKNRTISIILIILAIIIVVIIFSDFFKGRRGESGENPYELSIDDFKTIDTALIKYKEIRQIRVDGDSLRGLAWNNNKIYIVSDNILRIINENGKKHGELTFSKAPYAISIMSTENIVVAFKSELSIISETGNEISSYNLNLENSWFTSVTCNDKFIFVADAGRRRVLVFDENLKYLREFKGNSGNSDIHGFIVPSANFDLALTPDDELWVANPGIHSMQLYTYVGEMKRFWEKPGNTVEGFCGCCNPANFCILPNGNFITSEKKIVRIKEYSPSGELIGIVASPNDFIDEGTAPDVVCDLSGRVFALDKDKKLIRIYTKK